MMDILIFLILYYTRKKEGLDMVLYVIDKQKKGNCMQLINPKL